jgi:hypothetical protein
MEPSQRPNRPRTITICSTNVSKERLATEIGILNSPYPAMLQLPTIDWRIRKLCDKLDPQVLLDHKYEPSSHLQMGVIALQHCCKCPVVRCIVDQRTTNQGLEFKISWEESWVPERELLDLIRTSQTARDKLSRGSAVPIEQE